MMTARCPSRERNGDDGREINAIGSRVVGKDRWHPLL